MTVPEHVSVSLNQNRRAMVIDGVTVDLSAQEYGVAATLVLARGSVVTWERLAEVVCDGRPLKDANSIVYAVISHIKRKLRAGGFEGLIVTRHGLGVFLAC